MVNRLVLNLCNSASLRVDFLFQTPSGIEPPTFASRGPIIENLGAPVRTAYRSDERLNDEDDEYILGESKSYGVDIGDGVR